MLKAFRRVDLLTEISTWAFSFRKEKLPRAKAVGWCVVLKRGTKKQNKQQQKAKERFPGGTRGQWVLCAPASPPVNLRTVWSLVPNLDSGAVRPEDPQCYPLCRSSCKLD